MRELPDLVPPVLAMVCMLSLLVQPTAFGSVSLRINFNPRFPTPFSMRGPILIYAGMFA